MSKDLVHKVTDILKQYGQTRERANKDITLAFQMQFDYSLGLISILSKYFDCNGYVGRGCLENPIVKYSPHNKRDIFIIESLETDIKEYVQTYKLDYSTYQQAIITTNKALNEYKIKDRKLKRAVERHLKNKILEILIDMFLYREIGLKTFTNHHYILAFDFYNMFKDKNRLMEIELHNKTPIENPKSGIAKYKSTEKIIVKDLAEKIWDNYDDDHILMNDTVVNLIIENLPMLSTDNNSLREKELLKKRLKDWLIDTKTVPPEIRARGSIGATSSEEKNKRHIILNKITKEMKDDFESANQYLARTKSKISATPTT